MRLLRSPLLAVALGLGLASARPALAAPQTAPLPFTLNAAALPPGAAGSSNQQLANDIAATLRQCSQLRHYSVDIAVENGLVVLTGQVTDAAQMEAVLRVVQTVPGVDRIRNSILTVGLSSAAPAQFVVPEPKQLPKEGSIAAPALTNGMPPEPMPIFHAPPGAGGSTTSSPPPPMPPYAWPTYAPHNNASRVAYPTLYPQQSWPFIGPMSPFPKVPLGWRSIELKWQDGHWWYGRTATGHDWWRVRYW